MIVENLGLGELPDFISPKLGIRYLEILPYTPVIAVGINIHAEVSISDPPAFWERFNSPDAFIVALNEFGASAPEIISRRGISETAFLLQDCTFAFNRGSDTRISLRITRQPSNDKVRMDFNHEWRNFATVPAQKLAEIGKIYLDVARELFALTITIWPEVTL